MLQFLEFRQNPLSVNLVLFAAAAAGVWLAGTRLTRQAEIIVERTGAGRALTGLLLLGGVVSLPELSTAVSASLMGNARFAVNTLLGGISVTMVTVALVDAVVRERPLSADITHPVVLLQGTLSVLFLVVAAAGITAGDVEVLGVGVWSIALLILYLVFVQLVKRYQWHEAWIPEEVANQPGSRVAERQPDDQPEERPRGDRSLARLILSTAAVAAATFATGYLLAGTGDAIAEQTGLGASFVGLLLGGIVTSLPEASTVYAAVRIRRFELVFSDAYGSNLFSTMAIFFADLAYPGGPVLNQVGRFGLLAVLLGTALSAIFLAGCVERRSRAVLGMGVDSLIVLGTYIGGMIMLYQLR